jgi:hypothetical protein
VLLIQEYFKEVAYALTHPIEAEEVLKEELPQLIYAESDLFLELLLRQAVVGFLE